MFAHVWPGKDAIDSINKGSRKYPNTCSVELSYSNSHCFEYKWQVSLKIFLFKYFRKHCISKNILLSRLAKILFPNRKLTSAPQSLRDDSSYERITRYTTLSKCCFKIFFITLCFCCARHVKFRYKLANNYLGIAKRLLIVDIF